MLPEMFQEMYLMSGKLFRSGSMFYTVVTTGVSQNMLIAYAYIGITNVNGSLGTIATPFNYLASGQVFMQ